MWPQNYSRTEEVSLQVMAADDGGKRADRRSKPITTEPVLSNANGSYWVRSSSAKRPAKRSKTRLKSELDLATEIWSKNILRPNLGLSKVLRPDLSQETC